MNKTLSAPDYAEIYGFFFSWIPRNTTLDMGKICSMHENYVYGQLSKTELVKILDNNKKEVLALDKLNSFEKRANNDLLNRYLFRAHMTKKQMNQFMDICVSWIGKEILLKDHRLSEPERFPPLIIKGFDKKHHVRFSFEEKGWVPISEFMIFPGGF